jgi:hypothetical protein
MKWEKIILSFIAIVIGLFVASAAYFLYQTIKSVPAAKIPKISITLPTPTPENTVLLTIDSPTDESVITDRSIVISGQVDPSATLELHTNTDDQVTTSSATGKYSLTTLLQDGVNVITIIATLPNGQQNRKTLTITSSSEEF